MNSYYQYKDKKIFYSYNKLKPYIALFISIFLYYFYILFFALMLRGYFQVNETYNRIFRDKSPYMTDNQSLIIGVTGVIITYVLLRLIANFKIYKSFIERINYEIYFTGFLVMFSSVSILAVPFTFNSEIEFRSGIALYISFFILFIAFLFSIVILIFEYKNKKS